MMSACYKSYKLSPMTDLRDSFNTAEALFKKFPQNILLLIIISCGCLILPSTSSPSVTFSIKPVLASSAHEDLSPILSIAHAVF